MGINSSVPHHFAIVQSSFSTKRISKRGVLNNNIEIKVQRRNMPHVKVEIFLEQNEVAFLSPSKICENLNFSTQPISVLKLFLL